MKFAFDGCGSRLKVEIFDREYIPEIEQKCKRAVENFEQKYSRFIHNNFLHSLNTLKLAPVSRELVSLIRLAKKVSTLTQGHFDITVLPFLENRGYGIEKNKLSEKFWSENIEITQDTIILHNNVCIDLGSLGKWYLIDYLFKIICKYSQSFIIDFWGDIKVHWSQKIYLEDGENPEMYVWEICLEDRAIASSSTSRRNFSGHTHLINPNSPEEKSEIKTVFVTHKKAIFADIFATALHVSSLSIWEKILRETQGLSWYIETYSWKKIISKDFTATLYDIH